MKMDERVPTDKKKQRKYNIVMPAYGNSYSRGFNFDCDDNQN